MEESHLPRTPVVRRARVLVSLLATACTAVQAWGAEVFHFDIPAGNAEETLPLIYPQSKFEILYKTEDVRGVRTNAVLGDFEPQEALRRMLDGTGLAYFEERRVVGPNHATVPQPGVAEPIDSAVAIRGMANLASTFGNLKPDELKEVVVTGTRIRGVFDIMSPLMFVRKDQIRRAAYGGLRDALQSLPMSFGGGPSEYYGPGGNFTRGAGINLRGLGAGATLVLVNGRRQPFAGIDGNFVDISNIPWNAVERVEVLPDGASATYGSDAIAGVVNIIMRENFEGAETLGRVALASGGADETVASQLFGTNWDSGKLFFAYQFSDRTALAAGERQYSADSDKRVFGGSNFSSMRSSPGNIFDPRTQQPVFAIPAGQDGTQLTVDQLIPGQVNFTNRMAYTELLPDRQTHSVYFSASQRLGERMEIFGEARASQRDVEQQFAPSEQLFFVPSTNPFFLDPFVNSPILIVGYDFRNDLGLISADGRTRNYIATMGWRADIGASWKAAATASYGAERNRWTARNQVDPAALIRALADTNRDTAFNPFGNGTANNPATLDSIRFTQQERSVSELTAFSFLADGEVMKLPAGAAKLAAGVDYREEGLDHNKVNNPQRFGRRVTSAFAEVALPLIGNPDDPYAVPRLQLSLAARGESYSDFGTTFNPKIGLQYAPFTSVKLRGSWGTSFKAPSLVDLYDTTTNAAGVLLVRDALSPIGRSVVLIQQGSNPNLSEETADTWTAGVDFIPTFLPGLTMSLTYFEIDYRDRVFFPGPPLTPESVLAGPEWASLVTRNPTDAQIEAVCNSPRLFGATVQQCLASRPAALIDARAHNLSATSVRGIDLDLNRSLDTSHGEFTFGFQGTYLWMFGQAVTNASASLDILNTVDNPISMRGRAFVSWDQRGVDLPGIGVGLALDHSGSYTDRFSANLSHVKPWTRLNVNLSYRVGGSSGSEGIEFLVSALNILDADPPFVDRETGYDAANAEPLGRVVSFHVRKAW
jgi:iron complex outermembrane recepter protein